VKQAKGKLRKKNIAPRATFAALGTEHIRRVRTICMAMPEVTEKLSHGEPTFFAGKKVFAMISNNHHNDGHLAVLVPAPPGVQAALLQSEPEKYYFPPYVGGKGWVGIELRAVSDDELGFHVTEAHRLIAPRKLHSLR